MTSFELQIIELLESTQFSERSRGTERLRTIHQVEDLRALFQGIEERQNDGLRHIFMNHLSGLLLKDDIDVCAFSLGVFFTYTTFDKKLIQRASDGHIDDFLENPGVYQHLKTLSMRKCWKTLSEKERHIATRKIGNFRMVELLSLLLDNFQSKNQDLLILTMEIMKRTFDRRANRYMRQILARGENPALVLKSLEVLSVLGFFLDRKIFMSFLKHPSVEIQLGALEGLYQLKGDSALPDVTAFFHEHKEISVRKKIISIIGKRPTRKSIRTLLEFWQTENFSQVEHSIEWLLYEIEHPEKLDTILDFFPKASEAIELKIIVLLNEMQGPRLYDFYLSVIKENKTPFLTMAAMEAVAFYDDVRTLPYLTPFLKDEKDLLHYYALASYVKHSGIDLTSVLEDVVALKIPHDRHHHQLILNVLLEQSSMKSLSKFLQVYVHFMLSSDLTDNRYLSYAVVGKFHQEFELAGIFDLLRKEKNPLVIREAYQVFGDIFSFSPMTFIKANPSDEILQSPYFLERVRLSAGVLLALFEGKKRELFGKIQKQNPKTFWQIMLEILRIELLPLEMMNWVDFKELQFSEFQELWKIYGSNPEVSSHILVSLSELPDARFGKFLIDEYLNGRTEIHPHLSRYINGFA